MSLPSVPGSLSSRAVPREGRLAEVGVSPAKASRTTGLDPARLLTLLALTPWDVVELQFTADNDAQILAAGSVPSAELVITRISG